MHSYTYLNKETRHIYIYIYIERERERAIVPSAALSHEAIWTWRSCALEQIDQGSSQMQIIIKQLDNNRIELDS